VRRAKATSTIWYSAAC